MLILMGMKWIFIYPRLRRPRLKPLLLWGSVGHCSRMWQFNILTNLTITTPLPLSDKSVLCSLTWILQKCWPYRFFNWFVLFYEVWYHSVKCLIFAFSLSQTSSLQGMENLWLLPYKTLSQVRCHNRFPVVILASSSHTCIFMFTYLYHLH